MRASAPNRFRPQRLGADAKGGRPGDPASPSVRHTKQAYAGQEIILAKAGKPYARLMPLAATPAQRQPGRLRGQIDTTAFFDSLPVDDLDAWDGH